MSEATETTTPITEGVAAGQAPEVEAVAATESQDTDWVAEARKWEKRAKENASKLKDAEPKLAEYDRFRAASQSELERAQEAAQKAQDSITALRERAVSADLRAALTGVVPDPAAVIEDLNISRFVGDDGEVNTEAVTALRDKYAALAPEGRRAPAPNPAQGSSAAGASSASQLGKQDLERMYAAGDHEGIEKAKKEGRFNSLLGVNP